MRRRAVLLCVCAAAVLACALLALRPRPSARSLGLFCWDDATLEAERSTLEACVRQAGVTEVYQAFPESWLSSGRAGLFVRQMRRSGVTVYALAGAAQWARDPEGAELIRELEAVAAYNAGQKEANRITGVMADVEPYLLEEWDAGGAERDALMDAYLSGMRAAYACAVRNGLELWVCVPTFFDVTHPDQLEALVSGACDGVAVMNYNRTDEYGQMAAEVELARRHGRGVVCIYELQEAGLHGLEEINTYAGLGLEALRQSEAALEQAFGYGGLGFAYHYYKPLKAMLGLD